MLSSEFWRFDEKSCSCERKASSCSVFPHAQDLAWLFCVLKNLPSIFFTLLPGLHSCACQLKAKVKTSPSPFLAASCLWGCQYWSDRECSWRWNQMDKRRLCRFLKPVFSVTVNTQRAEELRFRCQSLHKCNDLHQTCNHSFFSTVQPVTLSQNSFLLFESWV